MESIRKRDARGAGFPPHISERPTRCSTSAIARHGDRLGHPSAPPPNPGGLGSHHSTTRLPSDPCGSNTGVNFPSCVKRLLPLRADGGRPSGALIKCHLENQRCAALFRGDTRPWFPGARVAEAAMSAGKGRGGGTSRSPKQKRKHLLGRRRGLCGWRHACKRQGQRRRRKPRKLPAGEPGVDNLLRRVRQAPRKERGKTTVNGADRRVTGEGYGPETQSNDKPGGGRWHSTSADNLLVAVLAAVPALSGAPLEAWQLAVAPRLRHASRERGQQPSSCVCVRGGAAFRGNSRAPGSQLPAVEAALPLSPRRGTERALERSC